MKRIWFILAIACLAMTGSAKADVWGRIIPNSLIARTQDKSEPAPVQEPIGKSAVQAPEAVIHHDGYPFADRCGCNDQGCCAKLWHGYSRSCGCGIGRGMFAHSIRGCGCGKLHAGGCGTSCCGGLGLGGFNSFSGGVAYGGCDCGGRGLGWHGCGLQTLAACGKHHLHGLRRACGFGCNSDCTTCNGSTGCSSCNGKTHQHEGTGEKNMEPPLPPVESAPMTDKAQDAPTPAPEKSAYRPSFSTTTRRSPLGF